MNIIYPNLNPNGNYAYNNNPKKIVLHHAEAVHCTINDINSWHKNRGWLCIGYHYFVAKDGKVYKGRPDNAQGAHCPGQNRSSIGVCVEGSYNGKETRMPEVQRMAVVKLCKYICNKHGIKKIYKHKDLHPTDCPGKYYPFDSIVKDVFNMSFNDINPITPQNPTRSWLQMGDSGKAVKNLQYNLKTLGYNLSVDGIYGQKTKTIVMEFQRDYSLKVDGLAGNVVNKKIQELLKLPSKGWLGVGDRGDKVKELQEGLEFLGYELSTDGIYGKKTKNCVYKFQKDNKLPQDGLAGKQVFNKLHQLIAR